MCTLLTKMTGRLPSTSESDTLRTGPSGPSVSDADFLPETTGDGSAETAGGAPSGPALTLTTALIETAEGVSPTLTETAEGSGLPCTLPTGGKRYLTRSQGGAPPFTKKICKGSELYD